MLDADLVYKYNMEIGDKNEKLFKPILERLYGKLRKTKGKYAKFDFKGNNLYIELKARRISITEYPTIMIDFNKITSALKCIQQNIKIYFCFVYTEGLYSVEFTQEFYDLNGGESKMKVVRYFGSDKTKNNYYINPKFLTKVDETAVWIHEYFINNKDDDYDDKTPKKGVCYIKL